MPLWKWSKTSANNSTADPAINWAEGQAPSSINDSARSMMARIAEWRDDITGAIATSGTATAYTVSSNQVFDDLAHLHGQMIAFTPHVTNGATVTLNVDSLGAKPLRTSPSVELGGGILVQGTPYVAVYNDSDGSFYLQGFAGNPYAVPLGAMIDYTGSSAPTSSFVLPYGQAISRSTYASYFSLVGVQYGVGDGSTTFNVPDLRGRVVAVLDNLGGSAANRLTSTTMNGGGNVLGAYGGEQTHLLTTPEIPSHSHANTLTDNGHSHTYQAWTQSIAVAGGGGSAATTPLGQSTSSSTTGITITNASTGGGGAHNNMPPTIVLSKILRVI